MIMGEYFVLHPDGEAIVLAVYPSIVIKLLPNIHTKTIFFSSSLGKELIQDKSEVKNPFLKKVLEIFNPPYGCEIYVQTEADSTKGMGTSAAFTVALVQVFQQWLRKDLISKEKTFEIALDIIRFVQGGYGSGADIAASVYGGMIRYTKNTIEHLSCDWNFFASYVGYKTKTADMITYVKRKNPPPYLYQAMKNCVQEAISHIRHKNFESFGQCMNVYHGLLSALGVSDRNIENLIYEFRAEPEISGSKISGSGLGDCVIACSQKIIKVNESFPLLPFFE
jgi:mevalonate kinase